VIPVSRQNEPCDFSTLVRIPGQKFLKKVPRPTAQQWKHREYWQKILPEMRSAYHQVCAYCATWIPYSTGNHAVDHFIPKSVRPSLAYEWSNYRYVSSRFNSRKGTSTILDPFTLGEASFTIDFSSFLLKANPDLPVARQSQIRDTIEILKLNADDDLVDERQAWIEDYRSGQITLDHLQKNAPFIAYELRRQDLVVG